MKDPNVERLVSLESARRDDRDRWRPIALASLLFAGAALRLWQFAGNASLWLDEIAIAENVVRRPVRALLFSPLDFDQVAPPGFLLAVKACVAVLGGSDLALRLFPLVCALACLGLFARVAKEVLSAWAALLATVLFSFGIPFISHAAEVKQYSSDIAISLLLTLLAFDLHRNRANARFLRAGIVGAVSVFFSHTAVFLLAGLGLGLALLALRDKDYAPWRGLLMTISMWAAFAAAAVAAAKQGMTPETSAYMERFWQDGFLRLPRNAAEALWLPRAFLDFWRTGLGYPLPALYLILMLLGLAALWRRRPEAALLLFAPVLVTLVAAVAGQYPFAGRLILFLAPAFLIAAAEGADLAARWFSRLHVPPAVTIALLALPPVLALAKNPPVYRWEDTKPVLGYLAAQHKPGDSLYVYYGAERAFRYYGPRFGLTPADVVLGGCHRGDLRAYLKELDRFRGRPRVWVLFAHSLPQLQERRALRSYLRSIGISRGGMVLPGRDGPVSAELYDLSVPERLAAASAETSPLPRVAEAVLFRFPCGGPLTEGATSGR